MTRPDRVLCLTVLILCLSAAPACASTAQSRLPPAEAMPAMSAETPPGLPPQTLAEGECGAFFWDRAEPNALRLFENESEGVARFWNGSSVNTAATMVREYSYTPGQFLNRAYTFPSGTRIEIEGEITRQHDDGFIISRAVMHREMDGGAVEVSPLLGLISCRF